MRALVRIFQEEDKEKEDDLILKDRMTESVLYKFDLFEVLENKPMKAVYFKHNESSSGIAFFDTTSESQVVLYMYHYENDLLVDYSKDEEDDNIDTEDETTYFLRNNKIDFPIVEMEQCKKDMSVLLSGLYEEEKNYTFEERRINFNKKHYNLTVLVFEQTIYDNT